MSMVTMDSTLALPEAAAALDVPLDVVKSWRKKGLISPVRGAGADARYEWSALANLAQSGDASGKWRVLRADRSGLSSIELFCGAGGLALGLHNAGLENRLVVDFDRDSIETIRRNKPRWNAVHASVADIDLHQYRGEIDVMAGGFPCQAFSYAGNKRGFEDARGTLFYEFARLVDQVRPRIVVGENVRGLVTHDRGRTLSTMISILDHLGYDVRYRILRAQFLDVPQKRERIVIVAIRKDVGAEFFLPAEKDYLVSLREALEDVPSSPGMEYTDRKRAIMELVPEGGYWRDLPERAQLEYMGGSYFLSGGKTGMARRLAWNEPSLTLTCNPAQKQTERCHPSETRPLTVREYARIQTFPDSWRFSGSVTSQYRQIGNAVPVNLGYHVGLAVRAMLGVPARRAAARSRLQPLEPNSAQMQWMLEMD